MNGEGVIYKSFEVLFGVARKIWLGPYLDVCQAVSVGLPEGSADKGKAAAAAAKQGSQ